MFIKYERLKDKKSGEPRTYVSVVEGFGDIDGKIHHRRIKSYGLYHPPIR